MPTYGEEQRELTQALRALAMDSARVDIRLPHAREEMENDGFDDLDVLTCLRKGTAYGLEVRGKKRDLRTNVVHRGLHIRVTVGNLRDAHEAGDWSLLGRIKVITVMRIQ